MSTSFSTKRSPPSCTSLTDPIFFTSILSGTLLPIFVASSNPKNFLSSSSRSGRISQSPRPTSTILSTSVQSIVCWSRKMQSILQQRWALTPQGHPPLRCSQLKNCQVGLEIARIIIKKKVNSTFIPNYYPLTNVFFRQLLQRGNAQNGNDKKLWDYNIYYRPMYNFKIFEDMFRETGEQYSCFWAMGNSEGPFLMKYRNSDKEKSTNLDEKIQNNLQSYPRKSSFKKSLKRAYTTIRTVDKREGVREDWWEARMQKMSINSGNSGKLPQQKKISGANRDVDNKIQIVHDGHSIKQNWSRQGNGKVNLIHYRYKSDHIGYYAHLPAIRPIPTPSSTKVYYNHQPAETNAISIPKAKGKTLPDCKSMPRLVQLDDTLPSTPIKHQTFTHALDFSNSLFLNHTSSLQTNDIYSETNEHPMSQDSSSPQYPPQSPPPNQLDLNDGPQNLGKNLSLNSIWENSQRNAIKRMEEVLEICSQADSEEDSDNESIVVGRLNEQRSLVEHKAQKEVMDEGAGRGKGGNVLGRHCFNLSPKYK